MKAKVEEKRKRIEGKFTIMKNGEMSIGNTPLFYGDVIHIPVQVLHAIIEDAKEGFI